MAFRLIFWFQLTIALLPLFLSSVCASDMQINKTYLPKSARQATWGKRRLLTSPLLGGTRLVSAPIVINARYPITDVFFADQNNQLRHLELDQNKNIIKVSSMGFASFFNPSVASPFNGAIDIVCPNFNGHLYTRSFRSGQWGGWSSIGQYIAPWTALSFTSQNTLQMFFVDIFHNLYQKERVGGVWKENKFLASNVMSAPVAITTSPGSVDLFISQDGFVQRKTIPKENTRRWADMPRFRSDGTYLCAATTSLGGMAVITANFHYPLTVSVLQNSKFGTVTAAGGFAPQQGVGCSRPYGSKVIDTFYNSLGNLVYQPLS